MTDAATLTYVLGAVAMFGGVLIVERLRRAAGAGAGHIGTGALFVVPGVATVAYALMAAGVGTVDLAGGPLVLPRYVDWLLTTPVLVGYVAYVAGASRGTIAGVAVADAAMIVVGAVAAALPAPGKYVAFAVSAGCHLVLLVVLYRTLPAVAAGHAAGRRRLFAVLKNHVGLLWVAYPVVWLASPVGLDLVGAVGIAMIVTYLDVIAKVPFVYFVYAHRRALLDGTGAAGPSESGAGAGAGAGAD